MASRTSFQDFALTDGLRTRLKRMYSESGMGSDKCDLVARGQYLCEAALWTPWEHRGTLLSVSDGSLLALDVERFIEVLRMYEHAFIDVVLYLFDEVPFWYSAAATRQIARAPGERGDRPWWRGGRREQ